MDDRPPGWDSEGAGRLPEQVYGNFDKAWRGYARHRSQLAALRKRWEKPSVPFAAGWPRLVRAREPRRRSNVRTSPRQARAPGSQEASEPPPAELGRLAPAVRMWAHEQRRRGRRVAA